ncbi:MAG: NADH-quinone oxidoreductase subunit L [Anaerolineae bacterium]
MLNFAWLLLVFPLLGALINLLIGRRLGKAAGWLGAAAIGLAFVVAVGLFAGLWARPAEERSVVQLLWHWITIGTFKVDIALLIDPLSVTMALVVTGVSALIHVYSIGYMDHEPRYTRYFVYLNFFVLMMLVLVMADNFLLMYVGWEGVGLASYLLIGFWFDRPSAADAGKKAFLVNRIGDFGMALAIMLIWSTIGTVSFSEVFRQAPALQGVATTLGLLLLLAATGKSAQIPLFVWLPDAMEGPTPVSALIHAATMVTAGVYMIARTHAIFQLSPTASHWVAWIGVLTAFMAGTIALVQTDLKRILAYSTISQLGYMFLGVGVGAYSAGIFHLITHAFFKALLFLGAGSVMHALHGELDIRKMGGLREKLPATYRTFLIGAAALAGVPLLSGFFSKDEILFKAFEANFLLYLVGTLTAFITAFYSFRAVFVPFWGKARDKKLADKAHEAPAVMTVPLWILAGLAVVGGLLNLPAVSSLEHWLEPVFADVKVAETAANLPLELGLLVVGALVAGLGIWLAYQAYVVQPQLPEQTAKRYDLAYRFLQAKWYVDELYMQMIVVPLRDLAGWLDATFDQRGIDGAVNGIARGLGAMGQGVRQLQTGLVGTYALAIVMGVVAVVGYLALR